ncbi:MAG TPA: MFS transporter [Acetobacteraceae bacterium]|nr:MFS transporter [Acetobacteraceae bacterium]
MSDNTVAAARPAVETTTFAILLSLSFCHLLNDMIQSLVPAIYPVLKVSYGLDFAQVGLITLAFQLTASLLQPLVGLAADRRPMPYSLPVAMGFTLVGLVLLARAGSFGMILAAAAMVGIGSSVFHPESSRVARMASGGRHGLAQSVFQVGGNAGSALGPLLAAFIVVPHGLRSIVWFTAAAMLAILILTTVGRWYQTNGATYHGRRRPVERRPVLPRSRILLSLGVLGLLIFSKFFYTASLNSYYTLYLIHRFQVSTETAELHLFIFLAAMAVGTFAGGPIGDRFGRKLVIWISILGVFPFTFLLPYANLFWTGILTVAIGLILASAFSAILVYATELVPGKVGMMAGMFFGFAFGMGGLGAALLGWLADATSIETVYRVCSYLPLIGLFTVFLPNLERSASRA